VQDRVSPAERGERGSYVGWIAGALSKSEYEQGLLSSGFGKVSITFTCEVADGMHAAIVKAVR
jgi:arsenite methyltransferase